MEAKLQKNIKLIYWMDFGQMLILPVAVIVPIGPFATDCQEGGVSMSASPSASYPALEQS